MSSGTSTSIEKAGPMPPKNGALTAKTLRHFFSIRNIARILPNFSWLIFPMLGLMVLTWFPINTVIMAGDFGWPIIFKNFFEYTAHIWDGSVNLGYSASRQVASYYPLSFWGWVLESTGLTPHWVQFSFLYVSFTFSGLGTYLLAGRFGLGSLGKIAAGILYMYGPFALFVAWNPAYGLTFPFHAFLPLSLFLFLGAIDLKYRWPKRFGFLFAFSLSPIAISFANTAYVPVFFGIAAILLLFIIRRSSNPWLVLRYAMIFFIFCLFLNAPLILSFASDFQYQFSIADNERVGLINDINTAKLNSLSINDAFRISGYWPIDISQNGDPYYPFRNTESILYQRLATYAMAILACFTLLSKRRMMNSLFLGAGILFILGIYLIAGFKMAPPFSYINETLIGHPSVLRGYRAIYLKLAPIAALPLALLAGHFFDLPSRWFVGAKNALFRTSLMLVALGMYIHYAAFPFYNGELIKEPGKILPSWKVSIPEEYWDLSKRDSQRKMEARYLSLPIANSYNYAYSWGIRGYSGYIGGDFIRYLLNKPVYFVSFGTDLEGTIIDAINKDSSIAANLLGLYNIRYIINHKDILTEMPIKYRTKDFLTSENTKKWFENDYLRLDVLRDDVFLPKIYPARTLIQGDGKMGTVIAALYAKNSNQSILVLPEIAPKKDKPISKTATVEFKRIHPALYRVRLHDADNVVPFVFNEACHPAWDIYPAPSLPSNLITAEMSQKTYKARKGNDPDQATYTELSKYISNGHITYGPDNPLDAFVSRFFSAAIQNDNLPSGYIPFGSSLDKEMPNFCGNKAVNAWMLDINKICSANPQSCYKNKKGLWDVDLILGYSPDKIPFIGRILHIFSVCMAAALFFFGTGRDMYHRRKNAQHSLT